MTNKNPLRYLWLVYYVVIFLWECLKANIDVAFRVIHPYLPIRPGTVKIKTSLRSDIGLTFLANSLTLTPGNTTI
ncbi:MAG: Na+/H+ antiporter subunit E, partial [Candidatus Omnitrophota bacterium]